MTRTGIWVALRGSLAASSGTLKPLLARLVRGDFGQVRPVGQGLQDRELEPGRDPEQQVGAGQQAVPPELEAEEAAVGDHQHVRSHRLQQPGGQLPLADAERADLGRHHGVRAAFAQAEDLDLRERPPGQPAGPAQPGQVRRRVRRVQLDPVDGHQPPVPQPRARRAGRGQRRGDLLEQQLDRRLTEPFPRLRDRPGGGHRPVLRPGPHEPQPAGQPAHHLLIAIPEDRHRHDEIHHDMGRQQPRPLLPPPGFRQHLINQVPRHHPGQHPDTDPVRQPPARDLARFIHDAEDNLQRKAIRNTGGFPQNPRVSPSGNVCIHSRKLTKRHCNINDKAELTIASVIRDIQNSA